MNSPVCPASFQVSSNSSIRVRSFVGGRNPSAVAFQDVRFKVQNPTFSPAAPFFQTSPYGVTITSPTPGPVEIQYTTDGVCPPPQQSPTFANGSSLAINGNTFLRAQAHRVGWEPSEPVPSCENEPAIYRVGSSNVVFSPPTGFSSNAPYNVTLTCQSGFRICFTIGTVPVEEPVADVDGNVLFGQELTNGGSLLISNSPTYIKAIAFRAGLDPSAAANADYRNIGNDAAQGEELVGPPGSGVQQPPTFNTYTSSDPTVGSYPWSRFTFVQNAGKVFGVVEGADKVRWWFPSLNQHVQFEHQVGPANSNEVMVLYHTENDAPSQL